MTAEEAIQLCRDGQAKRRESTAPATHHEWQDARRVPVPGGFRIYPIHAIHVGAE